MLKTMRTVKQRPIRITVLSILYIIFGALDLLGLAMAYVSTVIETIEYVSSVTSLLQFTAAYGLWKMEKWGVIVGVVEETISIIFNIVSIPLIGLSIGTAVISIGINIMFLAFLLSVWKKFS